MGRAQGQASVAIGDQFSQVLGARRGAQHPDFTELEPSAAATLESERMRSSIRQGVIADAVDVLASADVSLWERPLMSGLLGAMLAREYEEQHREWSAPLRLTLPATGIVSAFSPTLVAHGGYLHIAARPERKSWEPAGTVEFACGETHVSDEPMIERGGGRKPDPEEFAVMPRGMWASTDGRTTPRCPGCANAPLNMTPRQVEEARAHGDLRVLKLLASFDLDAVGETRRFDPAQELPRLRSFFDHNLKASLAASASDGELTAERMPELATAAMRESVVREAARLAGKDPVLVLTRISSDWAGVSVNRDALTAYKSPAPALLAQAAGLTAEDWERAVESVLPAAPEPIDVSMEDYVTSCRVRLRAALGLSA